MVCGWVGGRGNGLMAIHTASTNVVCWGTLLRSGQWWAWRRQAGGRFAVGIVGARMRLGDGLAVLLQTMARPLACPPCDLFLPSAAMPPICMHIASMHAPTRRLLSQVGERRVTRVSLHTSGDIGAEPQQQLLRGGWLPVICGADCADGLPQ